jgi:tRNA A37 methylthiotransferase MiaB
MCLGGEREFYSARDIIKRIKETEKKGCKKIRLVGACISDWCDKKNGMNLGGLVQKILKETTVEFGEFEMHPKDVSEKLLSILDNKRITKSVKIPIQHYSDVILKRMNRKYDSEYLENLFKFLKRKKFNVLTDIIVGFPGETESDVEYLIKFLKKIKFWRSISIFKYSARLGTPAYSFGNQIDEKTKTERCRRIVKELLGELPVKSETFLDLGNTQTEFYNWGVKISFHNHKKANFS